MRASLLLATSAAALQLACFPMFGYDRDPVEHDAVTFRDAGTVDPLSEVLVIPALGRGAVLGVARSHHDMLFAFGSGDVCLAHPFVHTAGARFAIPQPRTIGILFVLPQGFAGRVGVLEGALVVAPGHRSTFFDTWELLERHGLSLAPADAEDSLAERSELARILESDLLSGPDARWFRPAHLDPPSKSDEVRVCFTAPERELVRAFLARDR